MKLVICRIPQYFEQLEELPFSDTECTWGSMLRRTKYCFRMHLTEAWSQDCQLPWFQALVSVCMQRVNSAMSHEAWGKTGLHQCHDQQFQDLHMTDYRLRLKIFATECSFSLIQEKSAVTVLHGWSWSTENIVQLTVSFNFNKIVGLGN